MKVDIGLILDIATFVVLEAVLCKVDAQSIFVAWTEAGRAGEMRFKYCQSKQEKKKAHLGTRNPGDCCVINTVREVGTRCRSKDPGGSGGLEAGQISSFSRMREGKGDMCDTLKKEKKILPANKLFL